MDMAISLNDCRIFRFHKLQYLETESTSSPASAEVNLLKTFMDREHQSIVKGRFAGERLNPGTFFSLSEQTSIYEKLFYLGVKPTPSTDPWGPEELSINRRVALGDSHALFILAGTYDRILDLLNPVALRNVLQECYSLSEKEVAQMPMATITRELSTRNRQGNSMTDIVGKFAWKNGYNGVRFTSARAIDSILHRTTVGYRTTREALELVTGRDDVPFVEILPRIDREMTNVVIFRGAYLVHATERFAVIFPDDQTQKWERNPYANSPLSDIEQAIVTCVGLGEDEVDELCSNMVIGAHLTYSSNRGYFDPPTNVAENWPK